MQPGPRRMDDVLRVVDDTTLEPKLSINCLLVIVMVAESQDMSKWAECLASTRGVLESIGQLMVNDNGSLKNHYGAPEQAIQSGVQTLSALSGHACPAQIPAWTAQSHERGLTHALRSNQCCPRTLIHVNQSLQTRRTICPPTDQDAGFTRQMFYELLQSTDKISTTQDTTSARLNVCWASFELSQRH